MTIGSYICNDADHEGDPSDVHPLDRLEQRFEWRRLSDQARVRTLKLKNICRECMNRRYPPLTPVPTESLFGGVS